MVSLLVSAARGSLSPRKDPLGRYRDGPPVAAAAGVDLFVARAARHGGMKDGRRGNGPYLSVKYNDKYVYLVS